MVGILLPFSSEMFCCKTALFNSGSSPRVKREMGGGGGGWGGGGGGRGE